MHNSLKYFLIAAASIATLYVGCDTVDDSYYVQHEADVVVDDVVYTVSTTIKCDPIWSAGSGTGVLADRTSMSMALPDGRGMLLRFTPYCGVPDAEQTWKRHPVDVFLIDDASDPESMLAFFDARHARNDTQAPRVMDFRVDTSTRSEWRDWSDGEIGVLSGENIELGLYRYFASERANEMRRNPMVFVGFRAIAYTEREWGHIPDLALLHHAANPIFIDNNPRDPLRRAIYDAIPNQDQYARWRNAPSTRGLFVSPSGELDLSRQCRGCLEMNTRYHRASALAVEGSIFPLRDALSTDDYIFDPNTRELLILKTEGLWFTPILAYQETLLEAKP